MNIESNTLYLPEQGFRWYGPEDPVPLQYIRQAGVEAVFTSLDRKSTRLNSSHANISYAVFCLKKKKRAQFINLNIEPLMEKYDSRYTSLIHAGTRPRQIDSSYSQIAERVREFVPTQVNRLAKY